ncbi:MAG: hypothetical protein QMD61_05025 [Methanobacterium sp.]|nr:hypothetical protein [Methanobacterium sp.]
MKNRKKYQKPAIKTEKMFEKTVLACGKLPPGSGPGTCGAGRGSTS